MSKEYPMQPPVRSGWRRWVLALLGVQAILLVLVVVALWPLLQTRMTEIQEQFRPKKAWVMTLTDIKVKATEQPPFPIYVSPSLSGQAACTLSTLMPGVYRYPFTWTWYGLRAFVWNHNAVEVVTNPEEPGTSLKVLEAPLKACHGFVHKDRVLDVSQK